MIFTVVLLASSEKLPIPSEKASAHEFELAAAVSSPTLEEVLIPVEYGLSTTSKDVSGWSAVQVQVGPGSPELID